MALESGCVVKIIAKDGIVFEEKKAESDLEELAAELLAAVRSSIDINRYAEMGELQEVVLVLDERNVVIRALDSDYYAFAISDKSHALGRTRFKLNVAGLRFQQQFGG